jgi:diguanylate cyclase (GGDEF)-like protein
MSADNLEQSTSPSEQESPAELKRQLAEKDLQIQDLRERLRDRDLQIATLREIINTDVITKLRSRRATEEKLAFMNERRRVNGDAEIGPDTEVRKRVAALMLDIDHFKDINDTYGHDAGDEVLKQVGEFLKHKFRQDDFIGRWGGEEFLALLKAPDLDLLLNKFYDKASGQARLGFTAKVDGKEIPVTFSGGITLLEAEENIEDAIGRADKALYAAKKGPEGENGEKLPGRNQILPYAAQMKKGPVSETPESPSFEQEQA